MYCLRMLTSEDFQEKCLLIETFHESSLRSAFGWQVRCVRPGDDSVAGGRGSHRLCVQAAGLRKEEEPSTELGPRLPVHRLREGTAVHSVEGGPTSHSAARLRQQGSAVLGLRLPVRSLGKAQSAMWRGA